MTDVLLFRYRRLCTCDYSHAPQLSVKTPWTSSCPVAQAEMRPPSRVEHDERTEYDDGIFPAIPSIVRSRVSLPTTKDE